MRKWTTTNERPEDLFTAEEFYSENEVKRYAESGSMRRMQTELTRRMIELAEFKPDGKILDIGCGNGWSMAVLKEKGFDVKGIDPIPEMVKKAKENGFTAKKGDFLHNPFTERFDGILSISALQWAIAKQSLPEMKKTVKAIADVFHAALTEKGKAGLQFYPASEKILEAIIEGFTENGFNVFTTTDNPDNPRKRKIFLVLTRE